MCDEPSSDSSSDVDMNSAHIPHPKWPKTNVGVCEDPSSDSSSDVDMNSAHIPQPKQPNTNVHIPKFSYDPSSLFSFFTSGCDDVVFFVLSPKYLCQKNALN